MTDPKPGQHAPTPRQGPSVPHAFRIREVAAAVTGVFLVGGAPGVFAQQIITDGRTATSLTANGTVTDVTTGTVIGPNAFNSFQKFDVYQGYTVNLHVPSSAANLVNLVRGSRSQIDGMLNSIKDGRIGGNVFLLNPHGIVVGASGVINVGALTLITPTPEFVDSFFDATGVPNAARTEQVLAGQVPVGASGLISVQGQINTVGATTISAGAVQVAGAIRTGAVFSGAKVDFSDIVNVAGLQNAAAISVRNGDVAIVAATDVDVTGAIHADGGNNLDAAKVDIRAGRDIQVRGDAEISASGRGENSGGGEVRVYAGRNATLSGNAVVAASGGEVSGNGGFVEFSAGEKVRVEGGQFKAGATVGKAGKILIDPNDIELVSVNQTTDGADFELVANDSLTVASGVMISTRNVANPATDDHLTAASQGDSGNLTLKASHIELQNGSMLLAQADGGFSPGDVSIEATHVNAIGAARTADASFKAEGAIIRGGDVTVAVTAETSLITQLLETAPGTSVADAQKYLDNELDNLSDGPGGEYLAVKTTANAKGEIYGTVIEGSGNVAIRVRAGARAGFEKQSTADLIVGDYDAGGGAPVLTTSIKGQTVTLESRSDTSLTFNVLGTALKLADQSWLPDPDSGGVQLLDDTLFDFSSVPLVSLSTSRAGTTISGGTFIQGGDTVTIGSEGVSAAKPTFSSPILFSAAWGESTVEAKTLVGGTTAIVAVNKAAVKAATEAEVNVTADVNSINKPIDAVFVRAKNTATTTAETGADTVTTAGSVDVTAAAKADISANALAKNTGGSGVGIAVAVSESVTTTTATLGGTATAGAGDIKVDATTDIAGNNTSADAATLGNPNTISAKITNFKAGIQRNVTSGILNATGKLKPGTADRISSFLFPGIKEGKFNASGAVTYVDAENNATASIAPNAVVKAEGRIDVTSKITDRPTASVGAKSTSTGTAIGGSASIASFANNAAAFIGAGATVDAKGAMRVDAQTLVPYPWQIDWNSPEVILDHLQGSILDLLLTSYAINSAKGKSGLGLAVAVSVFGLENNAAAYIDNGAMINTVFDKDTMVLPNQSVTVHASNDVNTVDAVGILSKKFLGTSGGKAGIGGAANIIDVTENASATIRGDAQVKSENGVDVKAENLNQLVTVTEAGGSSDQVGIEGAVSINTVRSTTLAAIDDDATIDAGGNINVEALGDIETISVAGGVAATKGQVGIGFSVSLNTIDSDVSAFIGNYDPLLLDTAPALGDIRTGGNLLVKATSDTEIGAYSVAGAIATNSSSQTSAPDAGAGTTQDGSGSAGGSSGSGQGKFGIAVSGDASVNDIESDTLAYIADGVAVSDADNATLNATNALAINALAGAVTISTQQEGNGLSGSYAQNTLTGTTGAFISDASLTLTGDLDLDAHVTGEIRTLSASVAGTKGKVGVAGSVSVNEISNLTQAYLAGVLVQGVHTVSLTALDDSSIKSIAGAIAFGGKAGVGLSFAWNKLDNETEAYVDASDLDASGDVTLSATTDNSIDTISAAIGASKGNMAGAGAVAVNTLGNETRAYISGQLGGDGTDAAGSILIGAADSSRIFAIAGGVGATSGQAGVGLSFAWSDVGNTVSAGVLNGANVESTGGDVEVTSSSGTDIQAFAVSGGFANKVGIAGSVSVVQATNTVESAIDGTSRVTADGNVLVSAADDVEIFSLAGNVAGGGSAAIGVANSTLITDNTVQATLGGGADVTARGKRAADTVYTGAKDSAGNRTTEDVKGLAVAATSFEDIQTIAAGGAGGGSAGVAGSATVTVLDETTKATIGAGSTVNGADDGGADQWVLVRASDDTTLLGVAGAVAFGGSGGVGAGADVGVITKDTEAAIASTQANPTTVNASHTVWVEASNREDLTSISASLAAGGSAGVAGSASVYDMTLDTLAAIGEHALVRSDGNVVVAAADATEFDLVAGNGAFGGTAGVGASAGVSVIDKTILATIGANAEVTALGNAAAVQVADGSFDVNYVADSGSEGEVSAPGANPDGSDSQAIGKQRVAGSNTRALQGVAVTATNKDDVESISVTGSIGGTAAVTLAGNVNVITTDTKAQIADGARINPDNTGAGANQSVLVAAGNDHYHMGIAGSAAGGGSAGIGVGADVLVASHTTQALVGDSAQVGARRDVSVIARAEEEVLSISAGLGVSGTVGVAGSGSVISLNNTTDALTGAGSVVDAGGNVRIAASDDTETDLVVGTVAAGLGAAGVGGSVGVTSITKDTTAGVGAGATVNARGNNTGTMSTYSGDSLTGPAAIKGLSVQATSSEDVFSVSAAGAGGFYAGVSGAVTIAVIDSDTTASIGANADINKGVANGNPLQDVNVTAKNDVELQAITGSLAIGPLGAGVAGGVDVGSVKNDTSAFIGNGAEVFAKGDVDVNALAGVDLDSVVVSAAGGIVGVGGAVGVYSVGGGLDQESRDRLSSDGSGADGYADEQAADGSVNSLLAGSNDSRIRQTSAKAQTGRSAVSVSGDLATATPSGTSAFIGSATVNAGGDIDVDSRQDVSVNVLTGAVAGGAVGLGVGVGVVSVNGANQAYIAGGASVSVGNHVLITARTDGYGLADAYIGSGGVVAVDAGVAIINDDSSTAAFIGDGASFSQADDIDIDAIDRRTARAHAFGASVGAAAAGASVATASLGGTVQASVGANTQIGQGAGPVNDLLVSADSQSLAEADTEAAKAGLGLAAGGSVATASATPTVSATIGAGSAVTVQGSVDVAAVSRAAADADALGVNVSGGASAGASVATAESTAHVTASIGANTTLNAAALALSATQGAPSSGPNVRANATGASAGLLVGVNATVAEATNDGTTQSFVGGGSTLNVTGATTVSATHDSQQRADASGLSAGIVALGANISSADSDTRTLAYLSDDVKLTGGALSVTASGADDNFASATAGGGGVVSGLASLATTDNRSTAQAKIGAGTELRPIQVGTFILAAGHTARFNSQVDSTNAGVVGASGAMAENTVNASTSAVIGDGAFLMADSIIVQASNSSVKDWLAVTIPWLPTVSEWNVKSGSGGLFDLPAARSETQITNNALVRVGVGARVEQTGDPHAPGTFGLDAWNSVVARDKVKVDSGGAIAVPGGESKVLADTNNAAVKIGFAENGSTAGDQAELRGLGDIGIGARSVADVYAQVAVDTYGVAGAPEGESIARFQAANRVDLGNALVTALRDISLGAGQNSWGQENDIAATARTDLWNNTAIPISTKPDADAIVVTSSLITLAGDAEIGSARHSFLYAVKGAADVSGVGIGKDIYREAAAAVASAVSNAFGGEDVSFEIRSGRSVKNQNSSVAIDGSVKVGINRKQELEIDFDGTVKKRLGDISILSTGFKDVAQDILDRIAELRDLIRQYQVDDANADASIAVAAYESEIRFLERKLQELGYASNDPRGGFVDVPKISELQAAQEAVTAMTGTRGGYSTTVNTLTNTNTALANQNTTLASRNTAITNTEIPALQVQRASKLAERNGLDTNASNYAAEFQRLTNEIAGIDGQISGLQSERTGNTNTINANNQTIATNTTEINRLNGLITSLDNQIVQIQDDIDNNRLNTAPAGGPVAKFLTISDATAQLGNIYVKGDRLTGDGVLEAPGDAEIKITNNGPSFLEINNLTIPPDDGGKVYLNNIDVTTNGEINAINAPGGGAAFTITTADGASAAKPQIVVTSLYDPLDPFYSSRTPAGTAPLGPDIVLQGDISNLRGLVKVESAAGSIRVEQDASIRAGEVEIKTRNGDFVQSYTNAFFHAAGAPLVAIPGDPNVGTVNRIDRTEEVAGKGIIANGSVLIAARYLNINGIVQSGIPEWGVVVPAGATVAIPAGAGTTTGTFAQARANYLAKTPAEQAQPGAEYYRVNGATVAGLSGNVQGQWEPITVSYNAKEDRLELSGVRVQGGYIELFGQIFNTNRNGGGRLRVMDGYGQIKVDNQTNLSMVLNLLDTGRGVQGEINITDIVGQNADGTPIIQTTQYIRAPGGSRSDVYNPTGGQRYVVTVGVDTVTDEFYRYSQKGWFDIKATYTSLALDQYRLNSVVRSDDPLSGGEFLDDYASNVPGIENTHYYGRSQTKTTSSKITPGRSWKDCNWWTLCANATYYQEFTITTGTKTITTDSVKADYPIAIDYIGFDQGTVNVTSAGSLIINAPVNNRVGNTGIASSGGSITQAGDLPVVGGTNVSLAAATGIGTAQQAIQVNVDGGQLNAISGSGDVRVTQLVGDLVVGTVGGAGVSTVALEAERNLRGAGAASYVQGRRVELVARNGGIGVLDATTNTPFVVRTGYTADSSQWADYGLQATARDSINVKNVADGANPGIFSGNLLLVSADSATGDVRIETTGTVIDNNPIFRNDERTIDELNDLWDSMRLRGALAEQKADETVATFENGVTQDYRTYWNIRNRQADAGSYDPAYQFALTGAEQAQFVKLGWTDQQIRDFAATKTAEYHRLHERLYGGTAASVQGTVLATFSDTFKYQAAPTEEASIRKGSSWSQSQLELSVAPGLLKEITDTVTTIKDPNASGNSVTLIAGTGIGSFDAPRTVDLSDLSALTREDKAALAAAERGDAMVDPADPLKIIINQPRPINVAVSDTGALVATTALGRAFIGSEQDLRVETVSATGEIRIKTAGALVGVPPAPLGVNVTGGSLILEAAEGGIGLRADPGKGISAAPMRIRLSNGSTLIARASEDIYVLEDTGDINVDTVFSRKDVQLDSAGSILDAYLNNDLNIRSRSLVLNALGSIGDSANFLDVGLDTRLPTTPADDPSGWFTARAGGGMYVASEGYPLIIRQADAVTEARFLGGGLGITVDGTVNAVTGIDIASSGPPAAPGIVALTSVALLDSSAGPVTLSSDGVNAADGSRIVSGTDTTITGGSPGVQLDGAIDAQGAVTVTSTSGLAVGATGAINGNGVNLTGDTIAAADGSSIDSGSGALILSGAAGGANLRGAVSAAGGVSGNLSGALRLGSTSTMATHGAPVSLTAASMVLEGNTLIDAGAGAIDLLATTGPIVGETAAAPALLTGSSVSMTSANSAIGEPGNRLRADTQSNIELRAQTGVYYEEADGDFVSTYVSSNTGSVDLLVANGDAFIDYVSAPDQVNILVNGLMMDVGLIDPAVTFLQVLGAGGTIRVDELRAGNQVFAYADNVFLPLVVDMDPASGLRFLVAGANGGMAGLARINIVGSGSVVFDALRANQATVVSDSLLLSFLQTEIGSRGTFNNGYYTVEMDNVNTFLYDADLQLVARGYPFYLRMYPQPFFSTNADVINYRDRFIVNEFSTENSVVLAVPKLLAISQEEPQPEDKPEAAGEPEVEVPQDPLNLGSAALGGPGDTSVTR